MNPRPRRCERRALPTELAPHPVSRHEEKPKRRRAPHFLTAGKSVPDCTGIMPRRRRGGSRRSPTRRIIHNGSPRLYRPLRDHCAPPRPFPFIEHSLEPWRQDQVEDVSFIGTHLKNLSADLPDQQYTFLTAHDPVSEPGHRHIDPIPEAHHGALFFGEVLVRRHRVIRG